LISATSFATLAQVQAYAKTHSEYIKPDNNDWLHPRFDSFHREITPHFFQRAWMRLGFASREWDSASFQKLLQSVLDQYKKSGFKGSFAQRFNPSQGDTFIMWGDLNGAFHSLVRDLTFLQKEGIIDNNLKIKPGYYFIFNGNLIEGSPYILETLTLVFQLIQNNPNQLFYIRGYNEARERWQNFELINELKIRLGINTKRYNTIIKAFEEFFPLLSHAFYITQEKENVIDVVVIHNDVQYFKTFELQRIIALSNVQGKHGFFYYDKEEGGESKKINIRAFITGEDRSVNYNATTGLIRAGDIEGAIHWVIFSSPTERSQTLYKFYYDAFVHLSVTNGMNQWVLALFNQKVPELKGFAQSQTYNLVSGQPEKDRKEQTKKIPLTLGATMDLSKSLSTIGRPLRQGLELAFAQAARQSGVGAFMPHLVVYDDEYTPTITRQMLKKLKKQNIDILLNAMGSPTNQVYLPAIGKREMLNLFPYTGAPIFREPQLDYMAHYRVGYIDEGRALAEYALDELGMQKAVIFYQNDAFGKGEMQGAMDLLKERGFKDVVLVPYERNDVQFESQAKTIKTVDPDTIFFFAVTPAARSLIQQMGVQFFYRKNLIGTSVYDESFDRFLHDKGLKFIMVRMVPNPKTSDLEIVKEYRKEAEQANQVPNLVSLEAYINASIFFEILKRIKPPFTKEKFVQELKNIKHYNFKGIELNYNPETHELGKSLWLDIGEPDWIEKKVSRKSNKNEEVKPK
jgi:ABC-type branched-subunit amino acid transport system substrate-binding protein